MLYFFALAVSRMLFLFAYAPAGWRLGGSFGALRLSSRFVSGGQDEAGKKGEPFIVHPKPPSHHPLPKYPANVRYSP